jgi:disulfide oxidoreductase YuzD
LYVTYRGIRIDGFDYSNICFNLDTETFNTDQRDVARNISMHQILNSDDYLDIYNDLTNDRKKTFMKIKNIFTKYPFPVVVIEDKNVEDACKIFERINQGGKRLSIFDLVVAVTWDKDFELRRKINEFNKKIETNFGKIDYEVFTETLSLIINKQCTKAFQLKLTPKDVKENWPDVEKAIGKSIRFLRSHLKVKSYMYLPYRDMLALIAYYYYNRKDNDIDKDFLERWFWRATFANRYSGSSFNKIGEDRAYIFDRAIRGQKANINYDINVEFEN